MTMTRRMLIAIGLAFVLPLSSPEAAFAASPAPVEGRHGMVVTAQHLASEIGVNDVAPEDVVEKKIWTAVQERI